MDAYYNELDAFPAQWLRNLCAAGYIAPGTVDERDIREVKPDDVKAYTQAHFFAGIGAWSYALRLAGWPDDRPVWTGSCPCQPFSAAGKRGGTDDPRHLWPEWFRLIRECKPGTIFGEQVASKDGLHWLDIVCNDLESIGYAVAAFDLPAAGAGAPHIRQRLYFVAHTAGGTSAGVGGVLGEDAESKRHEGAEPSHSSTNDGMAHADRAFSGDGGIQRSGRLVQSQSDPVVIYLAHTHGSRRRTGRAGEAGVRGDTARLEPSGLRSAWANAEWLPCRDGKARPTQPGLFPLAHGAAARVGRLRAYGNSIVPQLAAEFIKSFMEIA